MRASLVGVKASDVRVTPAAGARACRGSAAGKLVCYVPETRYAASLGGDLAGGGDGGVQTLEVIRGGVIGDELVADECSYGRCGGTGGPPVRISAALRKAPVRARAAAACALRLSTPWAACLGGCEI